MVPSGLLSLSTRRLLVGAGLEELSVLTFAVLVFIAVITALVEFFGGGSIAARAGGASWLTTAAAATVGIILLMVVTGPLGLLVGLFGTVFVLEFVRNGELEGSTRCGLHDDRRPRVDGGASSADGVDPTRIPRGRLSPVISGKH